MLRLHAALHRRFLCHLFLPYADMPPRRKGPALSQQATATGKAVVATTAASTNSCNSFSALADAGEDAGQEPSSSRPSSPSGAAGAARKLKDPLVWIDLEMTGEAIMQLRGRRHSHAPMRHLCMHEGSSIGNHTMLHL